MVACLMKRTTKISWVGVGVLAFGGFVLAIAIPYGVSAPSNIRSIVLSPKFWPNIIGWVLVLLGLLFVAHQIFSSSGNSDSAGDKKDETVPTTGGSAAPWLRLLAMAALMAALVLAIPILGMVWATMVCFVLFAILVRSPRPVASLIVALVLPLALYGFFSHIAGVAVPQGEFVRLP
ncbi:MAG: tripartite tricarboxylate transporter TctB family protein [Candidatus Tectomicrobia bacterium]